MSLGTGTSGVIGRHLNFQVPDATCWIQLASIYTATSVPEATLLAEVTYKQLQH